MSLCFLYVKPPHAYWLASSPLPLNTLPNQYCLLHVKGNWHSENKLGDRSPNADGCFRTDHPLQARPWTTGAAAPQPPRVVAPHSAPASVNRYSFTSRDQDAGLGITDTRLTGGPGSSFFQGLTFCKAFKKHLYSPTSPRS